MVFVVTIIWGDLLDEVAAFNKEDDAANFFEEKTGVSFKAYADRRVAGEETEVILDKYAGTNIWELKIQ